MSKRPGSPLQRFTLWQWGLLVIFGGIMANLLTGLMPPPGDSAAARGQAFGRGAATLIAVVAGVVLIVMHFVRHKRPAPGRKKSRTGRARRR